MEERGMYDKVVGCREIVGNRSGAGHRDEDGHRVGAGHRRGAGYGHRGEDGHRVKTRRYLWATLTVLLRGGVMGIVGVCVFLFMGCEKELGNGGAARIRIEIADVPYGVEDGAVRSAGEAKSETVVVPLDREDGLCIYATLEENREGKGADLRAFTDNARLRIGVYDGSNNFVKSVIGTFSAGSFTLDGGETLDDVPTGAGYTFVAYSVNSATEDPDDYKVGEALEDIDPSRDLLYGKSTLTTIDVGVNSVVIPLAHKFSLVTLVAKTTDYTSVVNITGIDAELLPSRTANLPLIGAGAGVLSPVAASSVAQSFDFESVNLGTQTATSNPRIIYTGGANPTKIVINSVTIPELDAAALPLNSEANLSFVLQPGTSYTLTVSLKDTPTGAWAGSNIYWDGEKLTFDPAGKTDHALYQGVFFRWGSLVGIMTTAYTNPYGVYVPNYNSGEPGESVWSVEAWNPNSIPYMVGAGDPFTLYDNTNATSYGEMKGDICRYLGDTGAGPAGYRMPNGAPYTSEIPSIGTPVLGPLIDLRGSIPWTGDPGGTTTLPSYAYVGGALVFPTSGYYQGSFNAGVSGVYWTGSYYYSDRSYMTGFGLWYNEERDQMEICGFQYLYPDGSSGSMTDYLATVTVGHTIRCIKHT